MCLSIPAKVEKIEGDMAVVSVGGTEYNASLQMVDDVNIGDYILLHTGFALQKISENGFTCCCLAYSNSAKKGKYRDLAASISSGGGEVVIINQAERIEEAVKKLLGENWVSSKSKIDNQGSDFKRDENGPTKAEVDALLGA